ncbi:MAG: hypothetical protein C4K60_01410 [Ideonella sp. MAG2]|nr:MAG: hypothetical protein C4K60_01410 [Ideonella sp. MAG2]
MGLAFGPHIHHMGLAVVVKVGQVIIHSGRNIRDTSRCHDSGVLRRCCGALRSPLMIASRLTHALTLIGLMTFLATAQAPVVQAQVSLPALGDSVSDDVDLLTERKFGDRYMRELRRDPDFLDDPLLQAYIESLWNPLLEAARARGDITPDLDRSFAWEIFLGRDKAINAFAMPGGYVGVYLGLIGMTSSRDELASVLAHELSHISQRHIARGMANGQRQGSAALAAILLGLIAASRSNSNSSADAMAAIVTGGQAAMIQGQINFTREMEREADRIGFELLAQAGFMPSGMTGMFEKMEAASRLNDNNQFPYLRSHPLTIERISEARLRTRDNRPAPPAYAEPVRHALMQARAKVLMDRSETALRRLQSQGEPGSPQVGEARLATLYAAALASMQLREHARAAQFIKEAEAVANASLKAQPFARLALVHLKAQSLIERARASQEALSPELDALMPTLEADHSRPGLLMRAEIALARHRAGQAQSSQALRVATEQLQTWVTDHKQDATAWQTLAQCAEPLGLKLRAMRAAAEAAHAQGDVLGAFDRLRVAQERSRDPDYRDDVEASIIAARLRELEAPRRRLLAEMRGERPE